MLKAAQNIRNTSQENNSTELPTRASKMTIRLDHHLSELCQQKLNIITLMKAGFLNKLLL